MLGALPPGKYGKAPMTHPGHYQGDAYTPLSECFDFDVWAIACLVCGADLSLGGIYHVGTIGGHFHEHGLLMRNMGVVAGSRTVECQEGPGGYSCTVQVAYATGYGRGAHTFIIARTFGMGLEPWGAESHSAGRTVPDQYIPTGGGQNGPQNGPQSRTGQASRGAQP